MYRETDSPDTLTLTHESCLNNSPTSVSLRSDTLKCRRSVREVSRVLSMKSQCVELCVVGIKVSEENILIVGIN